MSEQVKEAEVTTVTRSEKEVAEITSLPGGVQVYTEWNSSSKGLEEAGVSSGEVGMLNK